MWSLTKVKKICMPILLLLLYLPIEIYITHPHPIFNPWMRYALFVFLLMGTSSLFGSNSLYLFRGRVFNLLLILCALLGIGSFFAKFLGINYMHVRANVYYHSAGLYGGLTPHSMLLGPIAGIGFIYLMYLFYGTQHKLLLVSAIFSMFSIAFSASRSSLIAAIGGLSIMTLMIGRYSSKIWKYIFIIAFAGALTFSWWGESFLSGFIKKNSGNTSELVTKSRDSKWENRLAEFSSKPICGVGFSSVDPKYQDDYNETGAIETGSSWLSVLSMTGVIGGALVLLILLKSFFRVFRKPQMGATLISGILTFFVIHMIAEGYIFAGGSILCALYWLTIGRAYDFKTS